MSRRLPWSSEQEALLGTMSDHEVARRLNRPQQTVSVHRRRLGIAAFRPPCRPVPFDGEAVAARAVALTAEQKAWLQHLPARECAVRLGINGCYVGLYRRALGYVERLRSM